MWICECVHEQSLYMQYVTALYVVSMVLVTFMIMQNFVLAIIGDAYGVVKGSHQGTESLFEDIYELNLLGVRAQSLAAG